jgi:hypothetical protein
VTKGEENLLAYQIQALIKKQDEICANLQAIFDKFDGRVTTVENKVSWIYGLLAGLGVVSIATLIKTFL